MDALTDGVFAIVATLLVLEIRVPHIPEDYTSDMLLHSLSEVLPSFIAFAFSFLTVVIYWVNHDHLSQFVARYTPKFKGLNLLLLFWMCLIPFPTAFVSEYPLEPVALLTYGCTLLGAAVTANYIYNHLAFKSDALSSAISEQQRKKYRKRLIGGPILYLLATLSTFVHPYVAIALYLVIPTLFVVLPRAELVEDIPQEAGETLEVS